MKKGNKIKTEVAVGIILLVSLIFAIAIYRAGSFSAALNYIPQVGKKKAQPAQKNNWVLFAENGERKIYKTQKDDGKWVVVVDGQEGEAYDDVFNPVFSDDGDQFAYGARNEGWVFVVLNSKASDKKYSDIGQLIFSQDGVLIYKVMDDSGEYLVIGDEEGEKYTSIGEIVIMDDGRIAFQAEVDGETVTVIDGEIIINDDLSEIASESESIISEEAVIVDSNPTTIETKTYRPKKDQVITTEKDSYPVCTGSGCNF